MKNYEKPMVIVDDGLYEGVYAASGDATTNNKVSCDSVYMNGTWQKLNGESWIDGYKACFGCHGCDAYRDNGCGLETDYVESGYASSYEVNAGNYKPTWEKKCYGPYDEITDWNC